MLHFPCGSSKHRPQLKKNKKKMKTDETAHVFVGDVCLDQRSVQAGLHIVQFLVVLEEHKSTHRWHCLQPMNVF